MTKELKQYTNNDVVETEGSVKQEVSYAVLYLFVVWHTF
jgi:hypothetical protein